MLIPLVVSLLATASRAQPQDLAFERILTGRALEIAQDHEGFLWVATGHGLIRYDGYETKTYRHDPVDSTSLAGTYVEVVLVDRTGTLWAGNHHDPHGGLNRYDRATDSFTRYRHDPDDPESLSHPMTTSLVEDSEGMLWVGTHGGLVRFDPETETFTRYRHDPDDPNSLSHDQVRVLYEDRQGTLWVGTGSPWHTGPNEGGLNRFHRATGTFTRYLPDPEDPKRLNDGRVSALFEDS
ncbi:MAG: two-component regulator propeller domain-containing protein, partial [Rhodothermales bacterium]